MHPTPMSILSELLSLKHTCINKDAPYPVSRMWTECIQDQQSQCLYARRADPQKPEHLANQVNDQLNKVVLQDNGMLHTYV